MNITSGPQAMRHARAQEPHVAHRDIRAMEHRSEGLGRSIRDRVTDGGLVDPVVEPDACPGRRAGCRVEQQPGLRLAVRASQVLARERRVRVAVDGAHARQRDDLDQERDAGRIARRVLAQHLGRERGDDIRQGRGPAVERLDHRPALDMPVGVGVAGRGRGAHPLLGPVVVPAQGHAPEPAQPVPAAVAPEHRVGRQQQRAPDRGPPRRVAPHRRVAHVAALTRHPSRRPSRRAGR